MKKEILQLLITSNVSNWHLTFIYNYNNYIIFGSVWDDCECAYNIILEKI